MKKATLNKLLTVSIFAAAMGYLEAVVVVYLREMFYPNGFDFPLRGFIQPDILAIEWVREFATIVMLVSVALLAGKKFYERGAYFVYAFAVWDIFYYIFLKIILGWPASLLTWDILFLIPWPWIGPVLAPVLCSLLMVVTAVMVLNLTDKGKKVRAAVLEWVLVILGIVLVLISWMRDYGKIIFQGGFAGDFFTLAENPAFIERVGSFIPSSYNWWLFGVGFVIACGGIVKFYARNLKKK
ncbi:MAG: hypothetical protein KKD18_05560 [Nanoarchaeota archaeon]|nr:hypothetical protein [Nanoarchaeota archaeon]MBU0977857.1 hypothetical protein [Nanoarchaeota archaeon]